MKNFLIAFTLIALVGCGGGGGSAPSSKSKADVKSASDLTFAMPRSQEGALTELVAKDTVLGLVEVFGSFIEFNDDFVSSGSVYIDPAADAYVTGLYNCDQSGLLELIHDAPSKLFVDNFRVYGAGDKGTWEHIECDDDNVSSGFVIDGKTTITVSSGVTDGFTVYRDNTQFLIEHEAHGTGSSTGSELLFLRDGSAIYSVFTDRTEFTTDYYGYLRNTFSDSFSYVLIDADLVVDDANTFSSSPVLRDLKAEAPFDVEIGRTGMRVNVDIESPVRMRKFGNDGIEAGVVTVRGHRGTLKFYVYNDHIEYYFDQGDDGIFEINEVITEDEYK